MKRILVVLGIVFGYTLVVECASVGAPRFLPETGRQTCERQNYGLVKALCENLF